jgi:hypothetical protein
MEIGTDLTGNGTSTQKHKIVRINIFKYLKGNNNIERENSKI